MEIGSLTIDAPIFLVGATGTGKSAAAIKLAEQTGAAILTLDAMQAYRGADIGTGKPTAEERAEVPHGGLDLAELGSSFDVAQYLRHAETFLQEQRAAERPVIIVGGTGLYFRALTRGLCEAPRGSEELRAELNALSVEQLQERLKKIDPTMLKQIDAANPRRLIRAIEVMEATGRSLRAWQEETPEPLVKTFRAFWIQREKEELSQRIARRVDGMFAAGWVEEVRGLVVRYGADVVWDFQGIGYREIGEMMWEMIEDTDDPVSELSELQNLGEVGKGNGSGQRLTLQKDTAVKSAIVVATRQYAKRQLTWFAREPNLVPVMLSGAQPFPADLLSLP